MGYRDNEVENLDDANRKNSYPLAAMIIGSLVILFSVGGARAELVDEPIAYALGSGFGAAVVVGGIAWLITLKHASTGWKIGALVTFFIVGTLAGLAKLGNANRAAERDFAGQMEQVMNAAGTAHPRASEGTTPLTKMSATMVNASIADAEAFDREATAAGIWQVISFEGLTKASPVLDHCDRVSGLADRTRYYQSRIATHLDAARAVGQAGVDSGELPQGVVDDFIAGARNAQRARSQWHILGDMSAEAGGLCRLLAGRKWTSSGGMVRFRSPQELAAANARLDRIKQLQAELQRMRDESRANVQAQIDKTRAP